MLTSEASSAPKKVLREAPKKLRRKCLVKAGNKSKSGSEEVPTRRSLSGMLTSEASSASKSVLREVPKKLRSLCLAEGEKSTHFSRLARKVAPPESREGMGEAPGSFQLRTSATHLIPFYYKNTTQTLALYYPFPYDRG
jgi:hypothetical protein